MGHLDEFQYSFCLYYLLPGEGYCVACPLSPRYRKLKGAAPAV